MRLTDNVRKKIAFEIFASNKTHAEIATEFMIARSTVTIIAKEFKLQRRNTGGHGNTKNHKTPKLKGDIATVNWTYDDALIKVRIQRRQESIQKEIERLVSAASNF